MSKSSPGTQVQTQPPQFTFVDLPELAETFADHVRMISFDGQTLRIEFCVSRVDQVKPDAPATGHRYPCCRLVLSTGATLELMNQLQRITTSLVQQGVLKAQPPQAASQTTN
jgi:hypothetical protein